MGRPDPLDCSNDRKLTRSFPKVDRFAYGSALHNEIGLAEGTYSPFSPYSFRLLSFKRRILRSGRLRFTSSRRRFAPQAMRRRTFRARRRPAKPRPRRPAPKIPSVVGSGTAMTVPLYSTPNGLLLLVAPVPI